MADFWDRLVDQGEKALDGAIRSGLESALAQFGVVNKPNQDPTAQQIANGARGQQPDATIQERNVPNQSMLRNNFFDISGITSNPVAIVGGLVGLAVVLGLLLRRR